MDVQFAHTEGEVFVQERERRLSDASSSLRSASPSIYSDGHLSGGESVASGLPFSPFSALSATPGGGALTTPQLERLRLRYDEDVAKALFRRGDEEGEGKRAAPPSLRWLRAEEEEVVQLERSGSTVVTIRNE
eukprot:CAMPEP_0113916650 /NCGR_PEP_ID=MMETSP0780_2-20120614/32198_1 /TAXON_ID=652834 /ORGANISM="Palpitomonas bilix" /LENGTH=132 /DNA_ID=CAMNT_0000915939 /DNA_START=149 /DNA_END=544 /DNA_ORIENTATION=- /assembly_acc=CAM_ASM_000599